MKNLYEEFEKIVKERGEWIEKFLPGIIGSAWKVGNFIVIFDETACLSEEKIVAVIETNEKIFYVLYISQSVFKNGIEELKKLCGLSEIITGEETGGISSKERLMIILEKIQNGQPKTGFFINRVLFDFFNFLLLFREGNCLKFYAQVIVPPDDLALFYKIEKILQEMPDVDLGKDEKGKKILVSCHMICRALSRFFPVKCRDGYFGDFNQHS